MRITKRLLSAISFLAFLGCSDPHESEAMQMAKTEWSQETSQLLKCLEEVSPGTKIHCRVSEASLKEEIIQPNGLEITMFQRVYQDILRSNKYDFSTIIFLIQSGADPKQISETLVATTSLENLKLFIKEVGGPNALPGSAIGGGSVMHAVIQDWDMEKVDALLALGVDLEQRNDLGETAILITRYSPWELSKVAKMNYLMDHGADPTVKDMRGKGVCEFLANADEDPMAGKKYEIDSLYKRLKMEFNMDCKASTIG